MGATKQSAQGTIVVIGVAASAKNLSAITKANPGVFTSTAHGLANGTVVKLDAAGGTEVWKYVGAKLRKTARPRFYFQPLVMATPVVSGGIVYITTTDGQLVALDAATGTELHVQDVGLPFSASPAVSGNAIFLASYNGTVVALVSAAP